MNRLWPVLLVSIFWLSSCTPSPPPKPPVFKLDHFKAYKVGILKAERPGQVKVSDQFLTPQPPPPEPIPLEITPEFIEYFATTVEKTTKVDGKAYKVPIKNPLAHLAWYPISKQIIVPKTVTFLNQMTNFKPNTINIELLRAILVPTEKEGKGFLKDLDHYLCWKVDTFLPGNQTSKKVTLYDPQFERTVTVEADGPRFFCNPCSKNGKEITNKDDHLAVYFIPEGKPVDKDVSIHNQFDGQDIKIKEQIYLLVPTKKIKVVPFPPGPSGK